MQKPSLHCFPKGQSEFCLHPASGGVQEVARRSQRKKEKRREKRRFIQGVSRNPQVGRKREGSGIEGEGSGEGEAWISEDTPDEEGEDAGGAGEGLVSEGGVSFEGTTDKDIVSGVEGEAGTRTFGFGELGEDEVAVGIEFGDVGGIVLLGVEDQGAELGGLIEGSGDKDGVIAVDLDFFDGVAGSTAVASRPGDDAIGVEAGDEDIGGTSGGGERSCDDIDGLEEGTDGVEAVLGVDGEGGDLVVLGSGDLADPEEVALAVEFGDIGVFASSGGEGGGAEGDGAIEDASGIDVSGGILDQGSGVEIAGGASSAGHPGTLSLGVEAEDQELASFLCDGGGAAEGDAGGGGVEEDASGDGGVSGRIDGDRASFLGAGGAEGGDPFGATVGSAESGDEDIAVA